ncbi:MAG: GNAT family N-acetyltransferase [Maricaulaceae bacterium]
MTYEIRRATPADNTALGEVMFDAVRHGRSEYSEVQRQAWTPSARKGEAWDKRLNAQKIVLAETRDIEGRVVVAGFMSLAAENYLDFAYIRPAHQGQGLFRRLYAEIETLARKRGKRIWVHASLMAQPAFTRMGFEIAQKEDVALGGEMFERFEMQKPLR